MRTLIFLGFSSHHAFKRLEFVSAQDSIQLGMHVFQVRIVAKARLRRAIDARLLWIEFPRMQIDDHALTVLFFKCTKRQFGKSRWKNPQISSAGCREVSAKKAERCRRIFSN